MSSIVLDTSAILAVAFNEAGRKTVMKHLPNAIVSAVTHQEVVSKLLGFDIPPQEIDMFLAAAVPTVIAFDRQQAHVAAQLHHEYRAHRLSYADCSCLSLATTPGLQVLTGDRKLADISTDLQVRLFR